MRIDSDKKRGNHRVEIVEGDKDPRVIYEINTKSGRKIVREYEYYKDEYYKREKESQYLKGWS